MLRFLAVASLLFADVTPRGDLFRPETAKLLATLDLKTARVNSFTFTRDSRRLVVLTHDGQLLRWNLSGGQKSRAVRFPASGGRLSVDGAATRALGPSPDRKSLKLVDLERGDEIRTFPEIDQMPQTFALSPDGRQVALSRRDQSVRIFDADSGLELRTLSEPASGHGGAMAWSPDGKLLAVHGADGTVRIFDPSTGAGVGNFAEMGRLPLFMSFSPDSALLVVVTQEARIRLYDRAGKHLRTMEEILGGCRQIAFSPDGKVMAASDVGGRIRMWDTRSWKRLRDLDAGVINHLAFSPNGRHLAVAMIDGTVKLWGGSGRWAAPPTPDVPRAGAPGYLGIFADGEDEEGTGALIGSLVDGGPAAKAGLLAGDRIVKVGTSTTESFETLRAVIMSYREGDEIEVTYKRGDAEMKVKLKLGGRPKDE